MTDVARVKDRFDLPEHLSKGAFVLKLAEGIDNPKTTAATYVVTPALVDAFERALRVVGAALRDGKSAAAYLLDRSGDARRAVPGAGHEAVHRLGDHQPGVRRSR